VINLSPYLVVKYYEWLELLKDYFSVAFRNRDKRLFDIPTEEIGGFESGSIPGIEVLEEVGSWYSVGPSFALRLISNVHLTYQ
jgi:hypothetical protein